MGRLISTVWARALERPWLLAAPLLGMLAQNVAIIAGGGSTAVSTAASAVLTSVVTALFAELWLGDGKSLDPVRLAESGLIYLIPYALLLAFGLLSAPLVYAALRSEHAQWAVMTVLYAVVAAGKLLALALGAGSSLAVARRRETPAGKWASLRLGFRTLADNVVFFVPALIGVWLFQEAAVYLARSLAPGVALAGFFTTAIPLLGCVALPIEAWREGRLKA